ncbi:histidinol dehydrogenase [Ruminococcaceae bacterium OttesenSCG-928-L11]|nr:histidinol dehydrogenase [Ruminococcaceae bacterium OttesenSCG-928-L11]
MIRILECTEPLQIGGMLNREGENAPNVDAAVAEIIATVRKGGDEALRDYTRRFDGAALSALEVTPSEWEAAVRQVDDAFLAILERAKGNIIAFHEKQRRTGFIMAEQPGVVLGQKIIPLDRVGIYVPGGTASYPSTVLMDAIPAKIAGVGEIVMVTPPGKDGSIDPAILAAAKVAGVDRIFKLGGAQAVAALAYGTESVPRVDKIVGPGNLYVATAKRMVYGQVDIDMIAGPSEILVIADETANPRHVAIDMLSQAEHDRLAASFLVTTDKELAGQVQQEIARLLPTLSRSEIATHSIETNGAVVVTDTLQHAVEISNQIAPEHLEVCTDDPFALLPAICHAGSIFLGKYAPEALGDYFAGPNHTLPTSGTARFSSPLSVDDYIKKSSYIYYDKAALEAVYRDVDTFARREGLTAHAESVSSRFREE